MRNIRTAGTIAMTLGVFGLLSAGAGSAGAATTGAHPACPVPPVVCALPGSPAKGQPIPAKPSTTIPTKPSTTVHVQPRDTVSVTPGKGVHIVCAKPGRPQPNPSGAVALPTLPALPSGAVRADAASRPMPADAAVTVTKALDGTVSVAKSPSRVTPAKPVGKDRGPVVMCGTAELGK